MRVKVLSAADNACGFYRCQLPAEVLAAQGADVVHVRHDAETGAIEGEWRDMGTHFMWKKLSDPEADVVVFQRPLSRHLYFCVLELQARGTKVVIEVDDDFEAVSPAHPLWHRIQPRTDPAYNWKWMAATAEIADLVTVTTPALAKRYGGHGRVAVLPNFVPERLLKIRKRAHRGVHVGWSGQKASHPHDLQTVGTGVVKALRATGAHFRVVGESTGVGGALGIGKDPPDTGWVDYDGYIDEMAQLDVGIVPLELTPFNEAKSWLKALEFSAVGVPVVASPTGPNRELAKSVHYELAHAPGEWRRALCSVLADSFRQYASELVRDQAAAFTIEKNAHLWWEAWERTVA